jgi:Zn-dependent peptidase ImmA (M78 family)/DNA-binding XRE family transcriptional regulator
MSAIPVKKELLVWARKFRSLTIVEAAKKLNIQTDKLEALESGKELPSLSLFEEIATKYRLPQATLFMKEPPSVPELPNDFRTIESGKPNHSFDFSVAFSSVNNFRRVLYILSEEDDEFLSADLARYSMAVDPETVANRERERLGLAPDTSINWRSQEAFNRWRALIESYGVPVFLKKFPLDDCKGFTVNHRGSNPIIVVNKSDQFVKSRIFTLIHEYCHLLIGMPGLSDLNNRNKVEAYCNKFAAAFLMPKDTLRILIKSWPNAPVDWEDKKIKQWSGRLKVSQIALALRLENLGLAPVGFSRRYSAYTGFKPKAHSRDGGDSIATTLSELGSAYTSSVFKAYERGVISPSNAEEYLGIKSKYFNRVSDYIDKRRGLSIVHAS